ncbi:MAG TPA: helix-turn-helix domain-containing protein [Candidatus Paceibacterota bacterium]|jgi:sugar-specific transcriptional regulator TrmB|nr:helix-turn-helix domain-containing protein [Candidatus Paceibacterota bacterium]
MDIKSLAAMGVGEKSAKVYLAGLALGTTSVQDLARKSGLKRPTVYLHLDDLVKQGLVEHVSINKKKYYRAVEPLVLEERLKKSLAHLQHEMPQLLAMRANTMGRPQVQVYEGEEGIRHVYSEMKKARSMRIWSNIGEPGTLHNTNMELAEAIHERATNVREIIAGTKETKRYSRLVAKVIGPSYSARTATVEGLHNDTIIYDDVVAIFRLQGLNMFVVRIEDPTIADTMRAMFEMAWKTARPFK